MTNRVFAIAVLKLFCRPIGQGFVLRSGDKKNQLTTKAFKTVNFMTNSEINKVVEYWFCVLERNNKDEEKKNKPSKMVDDFRLKNSMILKIFRTFTRAYILSNISRISTIWGS